MMRTSSLLPLAAAFALAFAAPAMAQEAQEPGLITITGQGEALATPDMATITSGVVADGETAREALDANNAAMAELIDVLKGAGIESRDIQTSGFSVQPNYVYTDKRDENGYQLPPKINGYRVSNNVTVRVRDLDSLGGVLDQAVTVGANTISNVAFSVSDPAALLDDARKSAVEDALAKANLYATAAGVDLGEIRMITEQGGGGAPQPVADMRRYAMAESAAVPVEAGELAYNVSVTIQWALEQ